MPQQQHKNSHNPANDLLSFDSLPVRIAGSGARIQALPDEIGLELPKGDYLLKLSGKDVHIYRTDADIDTYQVEASTAGSLLGRPRFQAGNVEFPASGASFQKIVLHIGRHTLDASDSKLPLLAGDARLVAGEMAELAKIAPKLKDGTATVEEMETAEQLVKRIHTAYAKAPHAKTGKSKKVKSAPEEDQEPAMPPPVSPPPKPTPRQPSSSNSSTGYSGYSSGGG